MLGGICVTMSIQPDQPRLILLTGATGYVGGRLLGPLEAAGYRVRCLVRRPAELQDKVAPNTEVVEGDLLDGASLERALAGVAMAYYLVHSMGAGVGFEEKDRQAASNFANAARQVGVRRIIYLGGLGRGRLSDHLASRQEVGEILRGSGVPTIEFRASIIIGPGSLSFELVRALVHRLPVMVVPRWTRTKAQPIAIDDVVAYLLAALDLELPESAIFEIGGPEQISYLDLMKIYSRARGLHRLFLPVPVLSPWLSSLWLSLVTPVQATVGRKLIEGVRNETVVQDDAALRVFNIRPRSIEQAIAQAVDNVDRSRG